MLPLILRRLKMSLPMPSVHGNGGKCYAGRYHSGHAVYFYDNLPDGRLYRGKFWFSRRYYNHPLGVATETATGSFNNGAKEGRWTFCNKSHGLYKKLTIEYAGGHHRGLYSYKAVCRLHTPGFNAGVTTLCLNMGCGHPTGSVRLSTGNYIITGNYDDDGRPDGLWKADMTKTDACRTDFEEWEHGVCKASYSIDEATGKRIETKDQMPYMVARLVYSECMPLEKVMPKGSSVWDGRL